VPAVADALGGSIEIYDTIPLDESVLLFSNRGLVEWRPYMQTVTPIALPGVASPEPVMQVKIWLEGGVSGYRFALFPEDGGTTYLLTDVRAGKVVREGLVNEAYPVTYWRQKSVEQKREMLRKAVAAAGLAWPPAWITLQNAETKPSGR
jgi:hypothetical protein